MTKRYKSQPDQYYDVSKSYKAPPLNWFLKPFENLKEVNVTKS